MLTDSERFAFSAWRIHAFASTGNAYDAVQTDETIAAGDTLLILDEAWIFLDHPLFAARIRVATRHGAAVTALTSPALLRQPDAWAMPLAATALGEPGQWPQLLADVAAAVAAAKGAAAPAPGTASDAAQAIAQTLLAGER